MSRPRKNSLYLHENAPLPIESDGDGHSMPQNSTMFGLDDAQLPKHGRDTVMVKEAVHEKVSSQSADHLCRADELERKELQLFSPQKPAPNLQDLSNLLYTRGRLQELGCIFTELGEMVAYGSPESRQQMDQMLRLGPIYDEQWSMFFVQPEDTGIDDHDEMWSDLRTLKKMLKNDGIEFGYAHGRLTHGDASPRIIRLCTAYDDLLKLWSAMVEARAPTRAVTCNPNPIDEQEEEELGSPFDDSGYSDGEEPGIEEWPLPVHRESGLPRNIGWRFSDDIDESAAARYRDSMTQSLVEEFEKALEVAKSSPLPVVGDDLVQSPPPVHIPQTATRSSSIAADHSRLRHGPSRLQVSNKNARLIQFDH